MLVDLGPEVVKGLLDLPLGHVVLLVEAPDLLLYVTLFNQQDFDVAVEALQVLVDFGLDYGLRFPYRFDVVVLVLAYFIGRVPWITHSGQMHSHLQSKQKYRIYSSWCSPQIFLDEMPWKISLVVTLDLAPLETLSRVTFS